MAQPLSKEVLDSAVDPAVVREQSFVVARRGFNQRQVQEYLAAVADALLDAQNRETDIRRRLGKAVRRAESAEKKLREIVPVEVDDTARQIGDEVATVLEAARLAADQSLAAAKEEADKILTAAKNEVEDTKSQLVSEGQAEAQSLRDQARADADAMLAQAADRVEQARTEGDNLIREATEARAQILEDMERRRRKARVQVERLRVGRDRLLRSYELVRRTLDETTGELKVSLREAKIRGDSAARSVAALPLATRDELEEELQGSQLIGRSAALPRPLSDANQAPRPRKPVVAQTTATETAETAAETRRTGIPAQPKAPPFAPVLTPASKESVDLATTAAPAGTAAPVSAKSAAQSEQFDAAEAGLGDDLVDITDEAMAAELAELADDDLNVVEPSDEIEEVLALPLDESVAPDVHEAHDTDESEGSSGAEATLETGLFAALRAQRGGTAKKRSGTANKSGGANKTGTANKSGGVKKSGTSAGPKGSAAPEAPAAAEAPPAPTASNSRFPGIAAQRDAVIADAAKQLEKRLKRALADEQNELLAGLRKGKRKKPVALAGLVGDPDKQLSRYVTAINEVAAVTYGAGAALIDAEVEHGQLPAGAVEELLVADVVSPIRDQLETLDRMEVASSDMHVDPVRSFYRQRKTDHLGDAATRLAHLLCVAGVCDALPAKAPLPWEVASK